MLRIEFTKLHGLGNDFVVIDNMDGHISLDGAQVSSICDRKFGVGADGVILVERSNNPNCTGFMNYINSDGTLAQMCGNGIRCTAKFLVDKGYVPENSTSVVIDTLSGAKQIEFSRNTDGEMDIASVDMGDPIFKPALVPVIAETNKVTENGESAALDIPLDSPWGRFHFSFISMGNPHAVTFIDNWESLPDALFNEPTNKSIETFDISKIGSYFESHEVFPEKANIEFAEIRSDDIRMRVFERGCGETSACGTGTCATSVAAYLTDRAPRNNNVVLNGGTLRIKYLQNGHIIMTGPAERSFIGVLEV